VEVLSAIAKFVWPKPWKPLCLGKIPSSNVLSRCRKVVHAPLSKILSPEGTESD